MSVSVFASEHMGHKRRSAALLAVGEPWRGGTWKEHGRARDAADGSNR